LDKSRKMTHPPPACLFFEEMGVVRALQDQTIPIVNGIDKEFKALIGARNSLIINGRTAAVEPRKRHINVRAYRHKRDAALVARYLQLGEQAGESHLLVIKAAQDLRFSGA